MNGNPSAAQKRFHDELRLMFFETQGGKGELHHVFGSKWKRRGFEKPGEWLVIMLESEVHRNIKQYSFQGERALFLAQLRQYESHYQKPHPVPPELIESYKSMLNRHDITKGNPL